ncbi:MAG TPA: hypothetical protein VMT94_06530 [Burkholderiales bacterium]|nr:hypothetical protein [Burkholderiales bacterium]
MSVDHPVRSIEIRIRELKQLFNSMDPTPFHHQDLDPAAEEFIVSWAREYPADSPLELVIHLERAPDAPDAGKMIAEAIHNYFIYRADMATRELREMMRRGRISLMIGLGFLAACLFAANAIGNFSSSTLAVIAKESLTIGGWVAMWGPMEIFLYDWWPLTARRRIMNKLGMAPVRLQPNPPARG